MKEAGYTEKEIEQIKNDIKHFEILRKEIQLASGDYIDLKQYEPAMRQLIDNYIGAEESRMLAKFDDLSGGTVSRKRKRCHQRFAKKHSRR